MLLFLGRNLWKSRRDRVSRLPQGWHFELWHNKVWETKKSGCKGKKRNQTWGNFGTRYLRVCGNSICFSLYFIGLKNAVIGSTPILHSSNNSSRIPKDKQKPTFYLISHNYHEIPSRLIVSTWLKHFKAQNLKFDPVYSSIIIILIYLSFICF